MRKEDFSDKAVLLVSSSMKGMKTVLATLTSLTLCSCTLLGIEDRERPETLAEIKEAEKSAAQSWREEPVEGEISSVETPVSTQEVPGVEVTWQAPLKPVELYHIRYGYSPEHLDREVVVPVDKLERLDHPSYGPVYRYRLVNVPNNRDLYVSLQAENRLGSSEPSPTMRVAASGEIKEGRGALR